VAHFVRIGVIESNLSGVGARGYQLFRRGRSIVARWGPVVVLPGANFRWVYWQQKVYKLASETAAKTKYAKLLTQRAATYSRLPTGRSIGG